MAHSALAHATFTVSSGAVCFGLLIDILKGAEAAIQEPPSPRPHAGGTVIYHPLEHNVTARNGIWNAYTLVDVNTSRVEGWFAASADIDPVEEVTKILRVSGSPYEHDSGSSRNNDKTRAERVLVINRYDWGMDYESDKISDEEPEGNEDMMANGNTIGLVDYAYATDYVHRWARQKPSQRGASPEGTWMYIPNAEYMFGRFGFDDDYTEARSFLFFTQRTDFFKTKMSGLSQPLRKHQKVIDWLRRLMREGNDLSGIDRIRSLYELPPPELRTSGIYDSPQPPPDSERLGPYDVSEHIFSEQDLEPLFQYRPGLDNESSQPLPPGNDPLVHQPVLSRFQRIKPAVLIDPWKGQVSDLMNELILSFLEHFVLPHRSLSTPALAGPAIFPTRRYDKDIDTLLISIFDGTRPYHIKGFDVSPASARVKEFLARRAGDTSVALNQDCLEGLTRVAAYLVTEMIELSDNMAVDSQVPAMEVRGAEDTYILPSYVRIVIYYDDLLDKFRYSASYWTGTGRT